MRTWPVGGVEAFLDLEGGFKALVCQGSSSTSCMALPLWRGEVGWLIRTLRRSLEEDVVLECPEENHEASLSFPIEDMEL